MFYMVETKETEVVSKAKDKKLDFLPTNPVRLSYHKVRSTDCMLTKCCVTCSLSRYSMSSDSSSPLRTFKIIPIFAVLWKTFWCWGPLEGSLKMLNLNLVRRNRLKL